MAFYNISVDELIQQLWMQFWQRAANRNNELEFIHLPQLIVFLQVSAKRAVRAERLRQRNEQNIKSIQEISEQAGEEDLLKASDSFSELTRKRFRERVAELLTDPLNSDIFRLYYAGYRRREIANYLQLRGVLIKEKAPTARVVGDALDRILKKLEADPEIRDLLGDFLRED